MKTQYMSAVSSARSLIKTIDEKSDWHFLKPASQLLSGLDGLLAFQQQSQFWQDWELLEIPQMKKKYSETELTHELRSRASMQQAIEIVSTEVACLKASYHARQNTLRLARGGLKATGKKAAKATAKVKAKAKGTA